MARSGAFAEKQKLDRATWQQVRDALKPGEATVEFASYNYFDKKWTGKSEYVALVVTHETKTEPEFIELGDASQIEGESLKKFQRAVRTRGLKPDRDEAALPGNVAYDLIWKPLENALAGQQKVYLALDGILNKVPVGIIPSPDGKLQMERYDLRFLSSTKDILRHSQAQAQTTSSAVLIGDPTFDLTQAQQLAAMHKLQEPPSVSPVLLAVNLPPNLTRDGGSGSTLPRLPGTGAEVSAIAALMQQHEWSVHMYTGDLAMKKAVETVNSPRILHIATHGFFLPDSQRGSVPGTGGTAVADPMLRSGLYFAGADRTLAGKPSSDGVDNGVLTAVEASNLNLASTELVVLSACNTGRGDVKTGEGVFGLRRALQEAGARDVLMSLWSVPDKETRQLMKRFYAKWLAGTEIHEALKEAQLEMRDKVKLSHDGKDLRITGVHLFCWGVNGTAPVVHRSAHTRLDCEWRLHGISCLDRRRIARPAVRAR